MENLSPPVLTAVREVKWRLAGGRSMRESIRLFLEESPTPFALRLGEWWALKNQNLGRPVTAFQTPYQKAFLQLIERGCEGQPTLEPLAALESEIESAAALELDRHISELPFKLLIPLLFFQFPAYLLLLLGPLLRDLNHQLGSG